MCISDLKGLACNCHGERKYLDLPRNPRAASAAVAQWTPGKRVIARSGSSSCGAVRSRPHARPTAAADQLQITRTDLWATRDRKPSFLRGSPSWDPARFGRGGSVAKCHFEVRLVSRARRSDPVHAPFPKLKCCAPRSHTAICAHQPATQRARATGGGAVVTVLMWRTSRSCSTV